MHLIGKFNRVGTFLFRFHIYSVGLAKRWAFSQIFENIRPRKHTTEEYIETNYRRGAVLEESDSFTRILKSDYRLLSND